MPASLVAIARRFLFVRETEGPNRGAWVETFQRFAGGIPGDSWCADFVSFVLDVAYHGKSPLKRTGSSNQMLQEARSKGLGIAAPVVGCLYFYVRALSGEAHHVGIVTAVTPLLGIAGNTSADGTSDNGTGVYEHALDSSKMAFARLP